MDAECARADLDDLRMNVWSNVESKATLRHSRLLNLRRFRFNFASLSGVLISAVLLIMLTASPVAREKNIVVENNIIVEKAEKLEKLEKKLNKAEKSENFVVKTIEKNDITEKNIDIKNNSLEILKDENLRAAQPLFEFAEKANVRGVKNINIKPVRAEKNIKKQAEKAERAERAVRAEKNLKPEKVLRAEVNRAEKAERAEKKPEKIVPYDKMFSLLETGARALRNETPLIEIK